ncbi:MAG: acyl-CoA thioesterase [Treponema sp.]|jgi:acyl-CoA thioester hydrolase|nr:acyl-CoA thioesterase [Treponema sp.]
MNRQKKLSAETEFKIEFYDVDLADVVWHGNYVKFFEVARRVLLDKIGYGYMEMKDSGYAFPVTALSVKYMHPLRYGDRVRARAVLDEYENCIKIRYELYNAATGEKATKGESSQMAFDIASGESCFTCPAVFVDKVRALLAGGNES